MFYDKFRTFVDVAALGIDKANMGIFCDDLGSFLKVVW